MSLNPRPEVYLHLQYPVSCLWIGIYVVERSKQIRSLKRVWERSRKAGAPGHY